MANPFSGLENIGQSYLQGVQLANQRQAREEAAAQRAEEARVRGQQGRERGVVHRRAQRVRDRIAEHAELARGEIRRPQGRQSEGVRRAHRSVPRRGRR